MFSRLYSWLQDALIPLVVGAVLLAGTGFFLQRLEGRAYDAFARATAKPVPSSSPVVLVLIDDASITRLQTVFGPMPWPRTAYVEIFKRINAHKPAVITLDAHFPSSQKKRPSRGFGPPPGAPPGGPPEGHVLPPPPTAEMPVLPGMQPLPQLDDRTFKAMKNIPNLIVGITHNTGDDEISLNPVSPYYYQLNLGLVNVIPSPDGVIQSFRPVDKAAYFPGASGTLPALSVASLHSYLNARYPDGGWAYKLSDERFEITGKNHAPFGVPLSAAGMVYLSWYHLLPDNGSGIRTSHMVIPAWKLFEKDVAALETELQGKIVMVGSSAGMYRDYQKTPMSERHMGTDIHATAVDNLLNNDAMRVLPAAFNFWLSLVLLAAVVAIRLSVRNPGRGVLYVCGLIVIYVWGAYTLFDRFHIALFVFTPVFSMLTGLLAASLLGLSMREKQVMLLEKNLSQLVSSSVLGEIRRRRHSIEPGGQRMEITSMFVDIRNFTAQAEHLPSHELTAMLNAFYARVVDIVFAHEGTIDKFMGDGILIIFGAPIPDAGHNLKAIACAREILEKVPEDIGISLNSGMAFVGFVGPKHKLEYTAVGDVVNLCARLQDYNKQYDARLIMGEATVQGYAGDAPLKSLGTVTVRGREAAIEIFTLA